MLLIIIYSIITILSALCLYKLIQEEIRSGTRCYTLGMLFGNIVFVISPVVQLIPIFIFLLELDIWDSDVNHWFVSPKTAEDEIEDEPQPVGQCSKCGTPVYSDYGFCGVCEPGKL